MDRIRLEGFYALGDLDQKALNRVNPLNVWTASQSNASENLPITFSTRKWAKKRQKKRCKSRAKTMHKSVCSLRGSWILMDVI